MRLKDLLKDRKVKIALLVPLVCIVIVCLFNSCQGLVNANGKDNEIVILKEDK